MGSVAATMMAVVRRGRTLSSLPSSTVSTSLLRESAVDQHGLTTISEDVNNIVNMPINNMVNDNMPINNMVSMPVGDNSMVNMDKQNKRQQHQQHHKQQQQQQQHQQHQHQRLPMPP